VPSHIKEQQKPRKLTKTQKDFQGINSSRKRSVAGATIYECFALNCEDISWVHNQYSSLKLIYHKMILRG
jgi:hypothetical protein